MKKTLVCLFAGFLAIGGFGAAAADTPNLKYGLYIHYGLPTFAKPGEQGEIPPERFAPLALDVKTWARAAKESGMTFAILTAKHHSGFCLWPSAGYDYDITHSPVKSDLLADFIAACNAEGILPGIHYSIRDEHNEGAAFQGPVSPLYFSLVKKHITELHTQYPGLRVQIIESSGRLTPAQWDELSQLTHRLNPNCVILDNRPGSPHPFAHTSILNRNWMWQPQVDVVPTADLFAAYNKASALGQPFLLNVGPAPSSRIPDDQLAVLKQMKNLIAQNAPLEAKPDVSDRLKKLQSLYDQGLITKDEFEKKKKEIVDSL